MYIGPFRIHMVSREDLFVPYGLRLNCDVSIWCQNILLKMTTRYRDNRRLMSVLKRLGDYYVRLYVVFWTPFVSKTSIRHNKTSSMRAAKGRSYKSTERPLDILNTSIVSLSFDRLKDVKIIFCCCFRIMTLTVLHTLIIYLITY